MTTIDKLTDHYQGILGGLRTNYDAEQALNAAARMLAQKEQRIIDLLGEVSHLKRAQETPVPERTTPDWKEQYEHFGGVMEDWKTRFGGSAALEMARHLLARQQLRIISLEQAAAQAASAADTDREPSTVIVVNHYPTDTGGDLDALIAKLIKHKARGIFPGG